MTLLVVLARLPDFRKCPAAKRASDPDAFEPGEMHPAPGHPAP
jgi:hypothetical protein